MGPAARRTSGAITHAPEGSLLGRLSPLRAVLRPPATGRQVLGVHDALEAAGIRHWLAGGWGVDALAGRRSRYHDDVDVVLDDFDRTIERAAAMLGGRGFRVLERDRRPTWMPDRWHLEDGANCHVELVSLDLGLLRRAHAAPGGPGGTELAPFATGVVEGCSVPCLSVDAQWIVHGGYEARPADLALLHQLRHSAA